MNITVKLFQKVNFKVLTIVFTCIMVVGIIFGFYVMPKIIRETVIRNTVLNPGSESRKLWEKPPVTLTFKIYLFNITNPQEVMSGSKPILQEVGPYIFDEIKSKYNLVDNETTDTVEYDYKNTFVFRPDLMRGLTGQEILTVPHLLIMSALIALQRENSPIIGLAADAIDIIFKPKTPFMTGPAIDLLFNGIGVDCNQNELSATLFCKKLASEPDAVQEVNTTYYKFSIFGAHNGTSLGRFLALRGNRNIADVGKVIKYNGKSELNNYDDDKCNKFNDSTDGMIFPPFKQIGHGYRSYSAPFCRSITTKFVGKSSYDGIPTALHTTNFGDPKNFSDLTCFCQDGPKTCPPAGTIDLMLCRNAPIILSKAHFFGADQKLLKNVHGLKPNKSQHDSFLNFEPTTGRILSAKNRIQLSVNVVPVMNYWPMANLSETVFPVYWLSEEIQLNSSFTDIFKNGLIFAKNATLISRWVLIVVGFLGMMGSFYMMYTHSNNVHEITRVHPRDHITNGITLGVVPKTPSSVQSVESNK